MSYPSPLLPELYPASLFAGDPYPTPAQQAHALLSLLPPAQAACPRFLGGLVQYHRARLASLIRAERRGPVGPFCWLHTARDQAATQSHAVLRARAVLCELVQHLARVEAGCLSVDLFQLPYFCDLPAFVSWGGYGGAFEYEVYAAYTATGRAHYGGPVLRAAEAAVAAHVAVAL